MCWVALDRAAALATMRGDGDARAAWRATAEEIQDDILAHGVSDAGVLRQHYDTDALDASTLLAPIFGFLGDDPASRPRSSPSPTTSPRAASCCATAPTRPTTACRARRAPSSSARSGVSALAIVGERRRARDLMERLLRVASPLGLYAEEFDTDTVHHLGNFPQAFSHLALIEAAGRIIAAEQLEELT